MLHMQVYPSHLRQKIQRQDSLIHRLTNSSSLLGIYTITLTPKTQKSANHFP